MKHLILSLKIFKTFAQNQTLILNSFLINPDRSVQPIGNSHWTSSPRLEFFRPKNLYMKTFQQWISTAIRPRGSKVCGNHVAGRKFSGINEFSQTRFLDFEPPEPNNYYPEYTSYTDYVANVFKTQE